MTMFRYRIGGYVMVSGMPLINYAIDILRFFTMRQPDEDAGCSGEGQVVDPCWRCGNKAVLLDYGNGRCAPRHHAITRLS